MDERTVSEHYTIFTRLAYRYRRYAPCWITTDDLVQDAWVAVCEGRPALYGIYDGLRRNKLRMRKTARGKNGGFHVRGCEEPIGARDLGIFDDWAPTLALYAAWMGVLGAKEQVAVIGLANGVPSKVTAASHGVTESAVAHGLIRAKGKLHRLAEERA